MCITKNAQVRPRRPLRKPRRRPVGADRGGHPREHLHAGGVVDPGSGGLMYPLPLMQWAAREKAEQGLWSISEVDYIKMACRFWNVSVDELIARVGGDGR